MTADEVARLGQRTESANIGLLNHIAILESTSMTRADFLLGRVTHGIDFVRFDAVLRELDAACRKHGDAIYSGRDGPTSLSGVREQLVGALTRAEPYRRLKA